MIFAEFEEVYYRIVYLPSCISNKIRNVCKLGSRIRFLITYLVKVSMQISFQFNTEPVILVVVSLYLMDLIWFICFHYLYVLSGLLYNVNISYIITKVEILLKLITRGIWIMLKKIILSYLWRFLYWYGFWYFCLNVV